MPRRNLHGICLAIVAALLCYEQVGDAGRDRHGRMLLAAFQEIEANYLEETDPDELYVGAMQGIVGRLDEFTEYFAENEYQEFQVGLDQQFGGVGIQLALDEATRELLVVSPLVGTPAYEAGIEAGDRIVAINGESTAGFVLDDALVRLRGRAGERVRLSMRRAGRAEPLEFDLVRAVIHTETVRGDGRLANQAWNFFLPGQDHLGYVRISPMFSERTGSELLSALEKLTSGGVRGMILDLRGNPGGLLSAAVEVCNLFVREGVLVSTRGRHGVPLEVYRADGKARFTGLPLVVLVDDQSASASEIVAACLQDHGRALVVGERTYGKGSVQHVTRLGRDGGALKLTMASYWRPSGRNIHRGGKASEADEWGVKPDAGYAVALDGPDLAAWVRWRRDRDVVERRASGEVATSPAAALPADAIVDMLGADRQLARAVECLRRQLGEEVADGIGKAVAIEANPAEATSAEVESNEAASAEAEMPEVNAPEADAIAP